MGMAHARLLSKRDGRFLNRSLVVGSGLLFLLAACGGGGGDDGGAGGVGGGTAPFTRTEAQAGDYFVYAMTSSERVVVGGVSNTNTSAYTSTVTFRSVASDGTSQRVTTFGDGQSAVQRTYNVNDAVVSNDSYPASGAVVCSYSPPDAIAPPYPRTVGQSWNGTSQFTCRVSSASIVQSGRVLARDTLSISPVGIFDAYRATRTSTATGATGVSNEVSTCWYEANRGVLLLCNSTSSTTPVGSSAPTTVISSSQMLTGLGGPNRVAQGVQLPRFQGSWTLQYSGGSSGTCNFLTIGAGGDINGSCSSDTGSASFAVTGTVNESGVINIGFPGGGALFGNLNTTYSGSGTWSDAGLSGTWTATHN